MRSRKIPLAFALSSALAASSPAWASFHLWQMNEVYSNADGSIQFLELTALAGGQQFLSGHTITTRVSATTTGTKVYVFNRDLPGDTAGRKMLIGTQAFANLGVATPDFIVPPQFFPPFGGTIDFAEGSDVWPYPYAYSCNGTSWARDGTNAPSTPTNFTGESGTVRENCPVLPGGFSPGPSSAPPNYHALWWRSPAGSENGWGLNIVQQGEKLFATWFTYDADGAPTWMVMDDARKVGKEIYFGTVYQTRGSPFDRYDPSRFGATPVGFATLAFSDSANGTFTYTIGNVTERKPITRFLFDNPQPTCSLEPDPGGNTTNYQDLWWRSPAGSEPGWGVHIAHQGKTLFATWFTYGPDGNRLWFMTDHAIQVGPNTYSGTVYQPRGSRFDAYDPSRFSAASVGSATFAFSDPDNGVFTYTVNGTTQSKPITRYVFARPKTTCHFATP
jgi:hypothetical protein